MEKKSLRQALCEAAGEIQRNADCENKAAASHALTYVLEDNPDEKAKALASYAASRAYEIAARRIDRVRQEFERGELA